MNGEILRRNRLGLLTPPETAIWDAMQAVEGMPASPLLTEAVALLGKAREAVADYVDLQIAECPRREGSHRLPRLGEWALYTYAHHDLDAHHQHLVGESRPAVIVRDFASGHPAQTDPTVPCYNLQVLTDSENDGKPSVYWVGSRHLSLTPTPGKFHRQPTAPHHQSETR